MASIDEQLDDCNRLWVLDSGSVIDDMVCDPKLLVFDLATDSLVQRIDISRKLAKNADGDGLLVTAVVETMGDNCSETKVIGSTFMYSQTHRLASKMTFHPVQVYMADMRGNGMVIWDGQDTWRTESPYFEPDSNATEFSVDGIDFNFVRGLFSLSITHKEDNATDGLLYFRPLSSYDMFHTNLADLQLTKNNRSSIEYFRESTKLRSQSIAQAFSSRGILFFSGATEMSILCWNRHKPFVRENIVSIDFHENASTIIANLVFRHKNMTFKIDYR